MVSSTSMLFQVPRPIPHSKPSRTSVASSLNRLSESIVRLSLMTTPLRSSRALAFRRISPERTMLPAMLPNLRGAEDLADLGSTDRDLFVLGLEQALESRLDLVDRLVDHRVVPDVDALAVRQLLHATHRLHVEADHDGVGDHGQVDVVLRDATDTAVHHAQVDLVADVQLDQRVLERLDGAGVVALDDQA